MPIYEYECPECGRFEVVQKVSDKPLNKNPDCEKANCPCKAERVISASAFHLKGSGWYKTDYKSGDSKSAAKKSTTTSSSKEDSTSSSSETKSEGSGEKKSLKTTGGGGGGCGSGCGCH